jgi:tetratricopeptide (TPR) repeat protein
MGSRALVVARANSDEYQHLDAAIVYLEQAHRWSPANPITYRNLAQAYLLQDQPQAAVSALEEAYRLQPESLLVQQELAAMYEIMGEIQQATEMWSKVGVPPIVVGDFWLKSEKPHHALYWYEQALEEGLTMTKSLAFRIGIASIIAGYPDKARNLLAQIGEQSVPLIYPVTDSSLRLDGRNLRWLFFRSSTYDGTVLDQLSVSTPTVGAMWWSGDALAVIDIGQQGQYILTFRAMQSLPPPILLALNVNQQTVAEFTLGQGNGSWVELSTIVELPKGLNTVGIRFLNDGEVDGMNRDAYVYWLEVREKSN